ncbi:MAG: hypothetical protein KF893_06265 [Caldilineaceae bacterium]|nr:hypothetical protein [Caldilineaceae bacterium]
MGDRSPCHLCATGKPNDNFYHLAELRPNALARSRQLKPQIPLVGLDGIPLRDEIELEIEMGYSEWVDDS